MTDNNLYGCVVGGVNSYIPSDVRMQKGKYQ